MNDILKQRLVGALILVALGVVFWPIIFVEPGDQPSAEQARIPPRPVVDTTPVEAPDTAGMQPSREVRAQEEARAAELVWPVPAVEPDDADEFPAEPGPEAAEAASPDAVPGTRSEPPDKLVLDSDGVPVAWILQVASVSSADKAEQLRERLLSLEHKAYVKRVSSGDRALYRVYIGPKFERATLEAMQPAIDARFDVKSMIARFVP